MIFWFKKLYGIFLCVPTLSGEPYVSVRSIDFTGERKAQLPFCLTPCDSGERKLLRLNDLRPGELKHSEDLLLPKVCIGMFSSFINARL